MCCWLKICIQCWKYLCTETLGGETVILPEWKNTIHASETESSDN